MNTEEKPSGPRLPVIPDARSALMDSIRKGPQLKKVDVSSTSSNSSGDTRTDLLSEIRGGIELRPVGERPTTNRSSGDGAGTDALADALRRALDLRKLAINGNSSSDSDSEHNQNSDDGEWSD
jgi:neural Wiskott-Aldrich syndrome protein